MNVVDIVLGLILIFSAYKGFTKGLIYQVASLVALILGIYGAIKFSDITAELLTDKLDITSKYLPLISFAVTFIGIVLLIHLLAGLTEKIVDAVAMGFVNRTLGLIFAIIKAVFILSICLVILNGFDQKEKLISAEIKEKSILYKPVYNVAPFVFPYFKFEMIQDKFDRLSEDTVI